MRLHVAVGVVFVFVCLNGIADFIVVVAGFDAEIDTRTDGAEGDDAQDDTAHELTERQRRGFDFFAFGEQRIDRTRIDVEKYADGKTIRSIVEDFNARGLRTKKGQPFNINSFSALLKNRKYIGEYRYQDVVIEGGVPAIVPEDLFNRVQERMEKNRHAPAMAKAKEDYLLTTKLFCGKCERMMVGESGKSHTGAMHYYYKCSGAKRLKDCDKKAVRKDWIERVVVRLTMQRVMDEEKINRLIDAILVMQEQEDTTTPALRSQLAETESSIGNILKAIEQGIFTPSTKQRLDELEARKEEILVNIQTAELQKPKLTREQMTAWFEQFRHGDPANRDFQKRLIDTFVNAVYVFDDKLVLTYNYQHGTQTISLDEIASALSSDFDGDTPP